MEDGTHDDYGTTWFWPIKWVNEDELMELYPPMPADMLKLGPDD